MRTPEQILERIKVEKGSLETLTGQLCARQDNACVYQDVINFMADAIRSLSNAEEELGDILEIEDAMPQQNPYDSMT